MSHKRKVLVLAGGVALLLALGVSQLQAQSPLTLEGLSERISELARSVSTLRRNSATKSEVRAVTNQVATLEARLDETPTATPTPEAPTATATPTGTPTATATATATPLAARERSTQDVAFVTTRGRMNIRSGPGTDYAIVDSVGAGTRLAITGKNEAGGWWRVDYQGEHAWIYAPFVNATNGETVEVVVTPAPAPQPTATPFVAGSNDDLALYLLEKDNEPAASLQEEWNAMSQEERDELVRTGRVMLEITAEYCNMPAADAAEMIDRYGQRLDDAGWSAGQATRARAALMLMLNSTGEADSSRAGCEAWLNDAVNTQIANQ